MPCCAVCSVCRPALFGSTSVPTGQALLRQQLRCAWHHLGPSRQPAGRCPLQALSQSAFPASEAACLLSEAVTIRCPCHDAWQQLRLLPGGFAAIATAGLLVHSGHFIILLQVQRQDVDAFLESRGVGELPEGVEAWATPHLAKRQAQQETEAGELQDLEGFETGEL